MRRLLVNPDTDSAWEIPLRTGLVGVGCAPDNEAVLNHPSVAANHCQLTVMDSGVLLKDLGSGQETLVDGNPVEETVLLPGQSLQLGEVVLRYEAAATPPAMVPTLSVAAPAKTGQGQAVCQNHPRARAQYTCSQCGQNLCALCVTGRFLDGRPRTYCPGCSGECTPLAMDAAGEAEQKPFVPQALHAFQYPLQGDGLILIISGGVFLAVIDLVSIVAISGFLVVFGTGYLVAFLRRIITSSANGEERMPDWPDITDFAEDIRVPFWQFIATAVFSFAPVIFLYVYALVWAQPADSFWLTPALFAGLAVSCTYFPMAFLALAMYETLAALNPVLIVLSILNIWRGYALTLLLLGVAVLIRWGGEHALHHILPIPILPTLIVNIFGLYLLVVEVRLLGVLYRTHRRDLDWS